MKAQRLYLAGGLFNVGERHHIISLEPHLIELGYTVIVPQREALRFRTARGFDLKGIVRDCFSAAANPENLLVGCIDGADADSGTAVEYGMAIARTGRAALYRTDFRTDLDKELGVNAMFRAPETEIVYHPCFCVEAREFNRYYVELAQQISDALKKRAWA